METNGAIEKPKGAHQVTYLVNWGQKGPYGFNGGHSEILVLGDHWGPKECHMG